MAEITLTISDMPALKRMTKILRRGDAFFLKKFKTTKTGVLKRIGKLMKDSIRSNFEKGEKSVWASISDDIILRRRMQRIVSTDAINTKPLIKLRATKRTFVDPATKFILLENLKFNFNVKKNPYISVTVKDTSTPAPDLHPFSRDNNIGELEFLSEGTEHGRFKSFNRGIRKPRGRRALLIPVRTAELRDKNIRKADETRKMWMKRAGILVEKGGLAVLMRPKANVGRFHTPKRRFVFWNEFSRRELNKILRADYRKRVGETYGINPETGLAERIGEDVTQKTSGKQSVTIRWK